MNFTFVSAGHIIFGPGSARQVAGRAAGLGRKVLVVTGGNPERSARLLRDLDDANLLSLRYQVAAEPDVETVEAGARLAREAGCDLVIGMGGGSVMDAAKAIAALATNRLPIYDYLEVIGKALAFQQPPLPCIAVPTTAGTGSEVTRNAVIRSRRHRIKVSLRSAGMLPAFAVVDPELTLDLPPAITAATGFDALCQLLEAYVSKRANPLTDSLCREGLIRCSRSLQAAASDGSNLGARTDMALASLFSGLALANAGLGAVHGIAGPLGGLHNAPHGAVCARLLPSVAAANIAALKADGDFAAGLERYTEIARILCRNPTAEASDGVHWLRAAANQLEIPSLDRWGLDPREVPALAEQAMQSSSMKGNPIKLGRQALEHAIYQALEMEH
jgi:alcohol dehydrogenase class IV